MGYGLESILTDSVSARIFDAMTMDLRAERYDEAIALATRKVVRNTSHVRADETPRPNLRGWWQSSLRGFWSALLLGMLVVGSMMMLRKYGVAPFDARRGRWVIAAGSAAGAVALGFLTGGIMWEGYIAVFAWGGILGIGWGAKQRFPWVLPAIFYGFLALGTLATSTEFSQIYLNGASSRLLIHTTVFHVAIVVAIFGLYIGVKTSSGGPSTYSSSGAYSGSSGYSGGGGGGDSGGGGSFGGGGASRSW